MSDVWRLYAGEDHVADLVVTGGDFPWLHARVEATAGLDRYRDLFAQEAAATDNEDWEAADRCYEEIRAALRLTYPDGSDVPEFLLHVDGDEARWRWSDEPFD